MCQTHFISGPHLYIVYDSRAAKLNLNRKSTDYLRLLFKNPNCYWGCKITDPTEVIWNDLLSRWCLTLLMIYSKQTVSTCLLRFCSLSSKYWPDLLSECKIHRMHKGAKKRFDRKGKITITVFGYLFWICEFRILWMWRKRLTLFGGRKLLFKWNTIRYISLPGRKTLDPTGHRYCIGYCT